MPHPASTHTHTYTKGTHKLLKQTHACKQLHEIFYNNSYVLLLFYEQCTCRRSTSIPYLFGYKAVVSPPKIVLIKYLVPSNKRLLWKRKAPSYNRRDTVLSLVMTCALPYKKMDFKILNKRGIGMTWFDYSCAQENRSVGSSELQKIVKTQNYSYDVVQRPQFWLILY